MNHRGARAIAGAAALAALWLSRPAWGQDQGPVVFERQQRRDMISFSNIRPALEFLYRRESDEITQKGSPKQTFTENRFEERLRLENADGYIYHPNLVELHLAGAFSLVQDSISGNQQTDQQNGTAYEWDVSAVILRKEEAPVTLYSRRTRDLINREFGPTIDNTITQTGGIVDWRNKVVPTRVEAYHQDQEQTSFDSAENLSISQDVFNWHSEAKPTPHQAITWDYTFNNVTESGPEAALPGTIGTGNLEYQTHDATLTHTYDFGEKLRNNLTSSLHYFNQSGDFAQERLRWDERLRMRHTENFETRAIYSLDDQSTTQPLSGTIDQTIQRGEVGFTHQLYKSLTTDGYVGFQTIDRSDESNSDEWFTRLDFTYVKQVPYGRFTANLGGGFDRTENTAQSGITHVINQVQTFRDPFPIIITAPGVIARSIVITDPSGLILYRPTGPRPDYNIRTVAGGVQIERNVGGRIPTDGTVLIDYDLAAQPANTVDSAQFNVGGRYDIEQGPLRGLSMYVRYSELNQDISSSSTAPTFIPNSFTDVTGGAEYKFWHFTVGAEEQMHDSVISPFDATRFWGRYDHRLSNDTLLQGNTAYTIIDYREPTIHIELWTVSAVLTQRISQRLYGTASVLYRNENDTSIGRTNGLEEQLELRWDYRQTHFFVMFRNSNLDTDAQSTAFQFLQVGLRREF